VTARKTPTPTRSRRVADLYGLPVEEFVRARNDFVRELKRAGKKAEAEEVGALRKPSVSAWTVNQLARRHPAEMKALVKAGDELRKAQRAVAGGRDPEALRDATRAHRDRLDDLTSAARHELGAAGATLQRVAQTLRGASVDKEASKTLLSGTLSEDYEQSGFGPLLAAVPASGFRRRAKSKAKPKPPPKPKPDPKARKRKQLQEKLEKERARLRELEAQLEDLD
jgi:hypothetical protein